jgi:hypothetical protein
LKQRIIQRKKKSKKMRKIKVLIQVKKVEVQKVSENKKEIKH